MNPKQTIIGSSLKYFVLFFLMILFLFPLFFILVNSFKPLYDIVTFPLAFPKKILWGNYVKAWELVKLSLAMRNTFLVTVFSVAGIILFSSMLAYWNARHPTWYSKLLTNLIVLSMLIPFVSVMLPLVQVLDVFHINNTLFGAVFTYWGIGLAFAYFIMRSAVISFPYELEEAAKIDGYSAIRIFFKIVFPLLAPTIFSVFLMDIFWIWNDFMIPLIVLNDPKLQTIQLGINNLFGMYSSRWDVALPALVLSIIPILLVFLITQKKLMEGVMSGALKG